MIPIEEAQLKLKDLKQALEYEKQHRFIDVQGRKKTFSRFMAETLGELSRLSLEENPDLSNLVKKFKSYQQMDLGMRMSTVESVETLLQQIVLGPATKRKTSQITAPGTSTSIHKMDVQYVKGVGPRLATILAMVGVHTVEDLLYYFPRRYLDYNNRAKIGQLTEGEEVTIIGVIRSVNAYQARNKNITVVNITIQDETGLATASWFYGKANRAQLESYKSRFIKGTEVMMSGKVKWDSYKKIPAINKPQLEILSYQSGENEPESLHAGRIVPIYPLTEGLNLRILRKAIYNTLQEHLDTLIDPIPTEILRQHQFVDLRQALQQIHFPESRQHYEAARQRLVFDELFYVQIRLALLRQQYKQTVKGLSLKIHSGGYSEQFLQQLPFQLTGAQQRVFEEIKNDLSSPEPMYRLLQGDVGSGKTVVAALTMLIAIENGYQAALMAPTEILAEQHYRKFIEWLTPLGLKVGLCVGKNSAKERRELQQGLLNGQIYAVVGTHALIQDSIEFQRLGLVVVDEQHRFGVRQRTLLKNKGDHPEMLTMTATPIPRSLAMTLHGDLDVSLLDELPPGRTPIQTILLPSSKSNQAYQLMRTEILKGRQVYVVFPLIEESETLAAKAATTEAEHLQQEVFPDLRIGLLHGKMRPEEKDSVMSAFARGDLDILVSTTVVEVGVDVPNATVMMIANADRFGLAQLHQLRGRVGRGEHQSYCVLVSDSRGQETMERLGIMVETQDGFRIAQYDLETRGPGEFLGTRQSGLPDLVLADLVQDQAILEIARTSAFEIVNNPLFLTQHPHLKEMIFQKTEETFSVLGAG